MKYITSLDKPTVIAILKKFKTKHGEYPTTNEMKKLTAANRGVIPSIKWIQNSGGIIEFYRSLGLNYTDARTGARRGNVAMVANKKSQSLDTEFSKQLVDMFGESNVHWQAPYNKGKTLHRSDFKVYKKDGTFFFIDLFFPKDEESFAGCVNLKLKKLAQIEIEKNAPVYFISCNEETTSPYTVYHFIKVRKTSIRENIKLIHISEAFDHFTNI